MTSKKFKFTLKRLENIAPETKRVCFYDSENSGFMLEVFPSGKKVFRTSKRNPVTGKINRVTIGEFPAITVELALKRHRELMVDIIHGNDPNEVKRENKRKGITFAALYELYDKDFTQKVKRDERRISSQEHNGRLYKNHLSKLIDNKQQKLENVTMGEFTHSYASLVVTILKSEKTNPVFNKCITLLKSMFNLALHRQLIDKNPFSGEKKFKDTERRRYLQKDEVERLFAAITEEEQIYQDVVKMLLFTGQRKNCVLSMEWNELNADFTLWSIPTSKMKGKDSHTLPLPRQCIEILQRRAENKLHSQFVFPAKSRSSKTGHIAEKTGDGSFWRRITRRAGLYSEIKEKNLTIHDLRRSLASWQINNNVDLYTVSKTLGHKNIATTEKVYAHINNDKIRDGVAVAVNAFENLSQHQDEELAIKAYVDSLSPKHQKLLNEYLSKKLTVNN